MWQRHVGLRSFANNEDVVQLCDESIAIGILDVNDVEGSRMTVPARDYTHSTSVTTVGNNAQIADFELNEIGDLSGFDVDLNRVVLLDHGIGVTDGATVVGLEMWNSLVSDPELVDSAQLVFRFFRSNTVHNVPTLGI